MKRFLAFTLLGFFFLTACTPSKSYRRRVFFSGRDNRLVQTAKRFLGVRYKRGGNTPRGFDCSGYVKYVYQRNGIRVPRTAAEQFRSGQRIDLRRAKPGDLVFFHTSNRKFLSHVGIYLGNLKFIHAPRTGKRISFADLRNSYWRKRYIGTVTYL